MSSKTVEVSQTRSGSWSVKVDGVVLNTYTSKDDAEAWANHVRENLASVAGKF